MGLFRSNCNFCNNNIDWFLDAPKDYICKKCNNHVSAEQIKKSFEENFLFLVGRRIKKIYGHGPYDIIEISNNLNINQKLVVKVLTQGYLVLD